MAAILSRERWVNRWRVGHEHIAVNIFQMHFLEGELMYLDGNYTAWFNIILLRNWYTELPGNVLQIIEIYVLCRFSLGIFLVKTLNSLRPNDAYMRQ